MILFMKVKQQPFCISILFFSAFIFTACVSTRTTADTPQITNDSAFIPEVFTWQPVAPGIERFDFENSEIPLIYHAVKIDLTNENLELEYFPETATRTDKEGRFNGLKTSVFAKKNDCIVAINASPFEGKLLRKKIIGIHSIDNLAFSPAKNKYSAITFSKNQTETSNSYIANIYKNQSQELAQNFDFAFGGFFVVLQNGQVQTSFAQIYDTRSGAGISEDGKTLYLLVVEGERKTKSIGLTYPQCGQIFAAMGCYNALELDGGGSSELCINGKSILTYKTWRIQANSFGFRESR